MIAPITRHNVGVAGVLLGIATRRKLTHKVHSHTHRVFNN